MKRYIYLILVAVVFFACEQEENNSYPAIKLGNGEETLSEISINKFTERKIILSGGNEKFTVNIEDSRIAKASVYRDTLKIKGLLEGRTFASIKSHSQEVILGVNVNPQQISISEKKIRLYPKDVSKFVSVNGGGDIVTMEEIDPNNILDAKWNGETGILELKAHFEGDAIIRFKSEDVTPQELKITVKSEGTPEKIGIYSTLSRSINIGLKPIMIVKRKNVGTWLSVSTNPYGKLGTFKKVTAKFEPIRNPKVGTYMNINVLFLPGSNVVSNVRNGINKVYVEEVNEDKKTVLLRGRGFKIVLPIEE